MGPGDGNPGALQKYYYQPAGREAKFRETRTGKMHQTGLIKTGAGEILYQRAKWGINQSV
jgi:hypothetical protein